MALTPVPETRKPRDDEIDTYGITHVGKVRKENQDQFLIALLHRRITVALTSLSEAQRTAMSGDERVGAFAMVADGVGGGEGGAEASAAALEAVTEYVRQSSACFYRGDS